jgi:hypothetical protein
LISIKFVGVTRAQTASVSFGRRRRQPHMLQAASLRLAQSSDTFSEYVTLGRGRQRVLPQVVAPLASTAAWR